MPMPSTIPNWNTGGANRTEPSGGKKVLGWAVGEPVDSSFFNWWMFTVYEWVLWLSGIEGETLTWSVVQNFDRGIDVNTTVVNGNTILAHANGTGMALYSDGPITIDATGYGPEALNIATDGLGLFVSASQGNLFQSSSDDFPAISIIQTGANYGMSIYASGGNSALVAQGGAGGTGGTYAAFFVNDAGAGGALFDGNGVALGVGARFLGATGIASPGFGATFQGGNPTFGTGKAGISSVGGSNAPGGEFRGGNGASGAGVVAEGSYGVTQGGPGLIAKNGLDTIGTAVDLYGCISFTNSTAPARNIALNNKLTKKMFAKAWVLIECNGTVTPTIIDGQNVSSVSQVITGGSNGDITVTLASGMATSTDYAVRPTWQGRGGSMVRLSYQQGALTATTATLRTVEGSSGVVLTATDTQNERVFIEFFGA